MLTEFIILVYVTFVVNHERYVVHIESKDILVYVCVCVCVFDTSLLSLYTTSKIRNTR
jgi:hypothetical protein